MKDIEVFIYLESLYLFRGRGWGGGGGIHTYRTYIFTIKFNLGVWRISDSTYPYPPDLQLYVNLVPTGNQILSQTLVRSTNI
jgi:hypothetical protein